MGAVGESSDDVGTAGSDGGKPSVSEASSVELGERALLSNVHPRNRVRRTARASKRRRPVEERHWLRLSRAMAERRAGAAVLLAAFLLLSCCSVRLVPVAEAVWLTIPSSGTKCVSEEIQSNVVVLADYYIVDDEHAHLHTPTISSRVTSPYGNNLHHNENVTHGQFAFTTSEAGNYLACFWIGGKHQEDVGLTIGLDWKIGIAAKDWESVAKKEKLQGMELELMKLEGGCASHT
ncbi:hypothetical protein NL676_026221 [Syzygium grande]|nr:hypothetical protein NL676_026221 [Syzygium grande]